MWSERRALRRSYLHLNPPAIKHTNGFQQSLVYSRTYAFSSATFLEALSFQEGDPLESA